MESLFGASQRSIAHPTAGRRVQRSYGYQQIYDEEHYAVITSAELVPAPVDLANDFYSQGDENLAADERYEAKLIRRQRVVRHRPTETPVSVSVSWLRGSFAERCPRLLTTERIPEGTPSYIKAHTGVTIANVSESVAAAAATEAEAHFLERDPGAPILRKSTYFMAMGGLVVEYSESSVLPDRWNRYSYQV